MLEGSKLTERQKLASVEAHSSLRSGLQDAGAYLVVEQLAEPTEYCREDHVSTKDPHEKDSPGALPIRQRTSHRLVTALYIPSMPGLGLEAYERARVLPNSDLYVTQAISLQCSPYPTQLSLAIPSWNGACPAPSQHPYLSGGTKLEAAIRF